MTLGIVSNCWTNQLREGAALEGLIERAVEAGYGCIELRQGSLGVFEHNEALIPDAAALARLPQQFPGVQLNVALAVPFLAESMAEVEALLGVGIEAAVAVSGEFAPHLRMVDPHTTAQAAAGAEPDRVAENIAALARRLASVQGILSLENARQPWQRLWELIQTARDLLGDDRSRLQLCYDPCNLLMAADRPDPAATTRQLGTSDLAMVHFKQACDGRQTLTLCPGDIDWAQHIAHLQGIRYEGPRLFEIPPHDEIWQHLQRSTKYLQSLGSTQCD